MFSITPFTAEDKHLIVDDNLSHFEKETWVAGYLWWPIDDEWVDRYMSEKGMVAMYNLLFDGEKVGNFSIWLDEKCDEGTVRVTRLMIYKKHRHRLYKRLPFSYWGIDAAVKEAKRLFPDLTPYAIMYDHSKNVVRRQGSRLLRAALKYGFEEDRRTEFKSKNFIIAEKIWLKLKDGTKTE